MSEPKTSRIRRGIWSLILLVAVLASVLVVAINQQTIADTIVAHQYSPTEDVRALRDRLDLTDTGAFYFNTSRTELSNASAFNQRCPQREPNSPILGCYVARRIFIYDIRTPDLEGIRETTAAHELLHAAYDRLDDTTKNNITTLLERTYEQVKTPELEERMRYYEANQPGEEVNELHSILGSEQMTLPDELEQYYKKYFANRRAIVQYYQAYNSVFISTINRIDQLGSDVNNSVQTINQKIGEYNSASSRLDQEVGQFNSQASSGGFESAGAFNQARANLVSRQDELESERQSINQLIAAVEIQRTEYNQLVARYKELSESINSEIAPTPDF